MCEHLRKREYADGRCVCVRCGEPVSAPKRIHEITESGQAPLCGIASEGRMERKKKLVTEAEAWHMADDGERSYADAKRKSNQRGNRLKDAYYEKEVRAPVGENIHAS